jgi:predicted alpha/beta-fold hydrolase
MKKFNPAWWAPGPHFQTILAHFLRPVRAVTVSRHRLETPDGDFVDYDYLEGEKTAPLVLILHGLEGNSQARYIRSLLSQIRDQRWHAVMLNHRGCSGEPNRLESTYHSGKTEDIRFVIEYFKQRGFLNIYAVGYSIGGNMLLKYLGESSDENIAAVAKAVCVSVPYDLAASVKLLEKSFINHWVYARSMLKSLKKKVSQKFPKFSTKVRLGHVAKCDTFSVFDEEVTARLNGFKSAPDYWAQCSSINFLEKIRTKVLLVHAMDDPFLTKEYLPLSLIEENPYIDLCLTEKGGHIGFLMGQSPWAQERWLEDRIIDYFLN